MSEIDYSKEESWLSFPEITKDMCVLLRVISIKSPYKPSPHSPENTIYYYLKSIEHGSKEVEKRKMRKKTLLTASMLISAGLLLGGCAGNVPQSPKDSTLQKESTQQSESAGSEGSGKSDSAENADPSGPKTDSDSESKADSGSQVTDADSTTKSDSETLKVPASEKELFTFMSGEWDFTNPVTHEDYAHIEVSDNGYFKYGYTGSDERCTGVFTPDHQYMGEENVPLSFALSVSGLDKMTLPDTGYLAPDDGYDSTYAKLYYGNCDGEDYIYMEETGNGDSFMSSVLFQDPKYPDETFSLGSNSFIMHRESSKAANASAETDNQVPCSAPM